MKKVRRYGILFLMLFWVSNNPITVVGSIPYTIHEPRRAEVQINDTLLVVRTTLSHNSKTWVTIHQEEVKEGETILDVLINDHQRVKIIVTTSYYK